LSVAVRERSTSQAIPLPNNRPMTPMMPGSIAKVTSQAGFQLLA
jgi:hypothetical protein